MAIIDPTRLIPGGWRPGVRSTTLANGFCPDTSGWTDAGTYAGATTSAATLNAAIAAAANNSYITITGTWTNKAIVINRSNFVLRGSNTSVYSGGFASSVMSNTTQTDTPRITINGASRGSPVNIGSTITAGDTSFTAAGGHGLVIGDLLQFTELNAGSSVADVDFVSPGGATWLAHDSTTRNRGQLNYVTNVSGNTITLERPMYTTLDSSPQYLKITTVHHVGIENLQVNNSTTKSDSGALIRMYRTHNCWYKGVYFAKVWGDGLRVEDSYAYTVYRCRADMSDLIYHGDGGRSYGFMNYEFCSDGLYLDCTTIGARHSFVFEGPSSGCVVAFCYSKNVFNDEWNEDYGGMPEDMGHHGAHPQYILYMQNVCCRLTGDCSFGTSGAMYGFRNWVTNHSTVYTFQNHIGMPWGLNAQIGHHSSSWVGNLVGQSGDPSGSSAGGQVLGTSGQGYNRMTSWFFGAGTMGAPGSQAPGSVSTTTISDTVAATSSYLHGNYSYIAGAIQWDSGNADHTIPLSADQGFMSDAEVTTFLLGLTGVSSTSPISSGAPTANSVIPAVYRENNGGNSPSSAPLVTAASINAAGTSLTLTMDASVSVGAGGNTGMVITIGGVDYTATYASGAPGTSLVFTVAKVWQGATVVAKYTNPGNGLEGTSGGLDVGDFSSQVVTNNSTQALAAPTIGTATATGSSTITLTWTDTSSGVASFKVYRSLTNGSFTSVVASPAAGVTSFNDTALSAATQYFYVVSQVVPGVESSQSSSANATTTGSGTPETSGTRGQVQTKGQVIFK